MSPGARPGRAGSEGDDAKPIIRPGGLVDPDALRAAPPAIPRSEDVLETDGDGDDDAPRRVAFRLARDLQKRLDRYLTDRIPFMSRTQLQRLIENEQVTVNGRAPKASTVLRQGDLVVVLVPPPPPTDIQPEQIPLDILYEDDDILVVNKRPGIIVHPARSNLSGTMVNAVAWHLRHASARGGALSRVGREFARPGVVHRLDRDTTGVIVFAKCDEAHWKLARQFEQRTVDKRYLALVQGVCEPLVDVIDLPIGPHQSREKGYREKYVVRHDELGKASVTIYRVIEAFDGWSLVEVELKTGRTHQIRVHMTHRGYPLVGDDMYGGKALTRADLGLPGPDADLLARQALHAAVLAFRHPIVGDAMRFLAPVPVDLARAIAALRAHRPGAGPTGVSGAVIDPLSIAPS